LNGTSVDESIPILKQTPNLVHCELGLFYENSGPLPELTLLGLESLALTQLGITSVPVYLHAIITPALRFFEVPESFLGSNQIDALASSISKSGCELHEVHITGDWSIGLGAFRVAFPSIPIFS
jgi:hypothetical protein